MDNAGTVSTELRNMERDIKFYRVSDDFGEFSNFALYPIKIKGKKWPTSEHYFQAMKFKSKSDQNEIQRAKSPMEAAKKGRDRKRALRKDWGAIKDEIMREAVMAKFTQHEGLKRILLATENARIVEHTASDSYWGDGGNGKGRNMLGKILVETREILKNGGNS